ncbi:GIY-YIG nuclease family protein [Notoacmeibacter marinus]|uniref:GIY-YIG nuclease family protein n=1 Tax=Notoacmeibacter marinus TaxID=1876515 RepID=UPI000DF1A396|nr:GIY-YIG nuclease family protein [Notoacmeibacter marinus]
MTGFVYMLASQKNGTLYVGVTNSLARRIPEHREAKKGFTARYGCHRLVWYEEHFDVRDAIQREKTMKRWPRAWKVALIEEHNPDWNELFTGWGWE